MKNVALVDVDNSEKVKFPNLVLMKASTYYKSLGYNVKLIHGDLLNQYNKEYERGRASKTHFSFLPDIVIKSKVFTWTKDKNLFYNDEYYEGGTGFDITKKIIPEIDRAYPDYDLYKGKYGTKIIRRNKDKRKVLFENAGIGFITRGCYRNCSFCFVPKKEGMIHPYMKIEDFKKPDSNLLIMLDNNILAHKHGISEIKRMVDMGLRVDFNQGLDPHIISAREDIAELLGSLNWINQVRLACDEQKDKPALKKSVELLRKYDCKGRIFAYAIITNDVEETYDRIKFIDSLDVIPYSQCYRDIKNTPPTIYMRALQSWVQSAVGGRFFSLSFEEFLNIFLRYQPDKKNWRDKHQSEEFKKLYESGVHFKNERNMELSKTITELMDERIKKDTLKHDLIQKELDHERDVYKAFFSKKDPE